jgi:hypothetical protein
MANFPDQLFSGDQRFDGSAHAVGTVQTSGEASGGIKRVVVADLWISGGCRGGSVGCIRSGDASVGHQRIAGTLGTENNLEQPDFASTSASSGSLAVFHA